MNTTFYLMANTKDLKYQNQNQNLHGTFIRDPDSIRIRSENPDIRRGRIRIRIDPNPDPDIRRILQFLEGYPTPEYPRTPDPDKDSKIMDPPDKDPDPDTLKLPGYPIPTKFSRALLRENACEDSPDVRRRVRAFRGVEAFSALRRRLRLGEGGGFYSSIVFGFDSEG
ncbi:hypothetical protein YC2023_075895 [Brassica napus]